MNKLPPEWWPQSAAMLTWPHANGDWGDQIERVEQVFINLARAISARQKLIISVADEAIEPLKSLLSNADATMERISIYAAQSNDIWVRDHGPLTVLKNDQPHLLDFQFNGWGGKYQADMDNAITRRLHLQSVFGESSIQTIPRVIEGGAIEVNGAGALLTTANCLSLRSRNPGITEAALEDLFADWFGCRKIHWLRHGHLEGDDTDGHIDTLARFCSPTLIAYQSCDDEDDPHYAPLQAMAQELRKLRDTQGKPYKLCALPFPKPMTNAQGDRLPAGYANFLIINGAVLVPTYNDPADIKAAAKLAECFPAHEIVTIDCCALVEQYGSLHCATMQLPLGVVAA